MKCCNLCLASKTIQHKLYRDLQLLLISTNQYKDLSIDFVTGLSVSTNRKHKTYNFIKFIMDQLTKIVHYKQVKITINDLKLTKVIIIMML